VNQRWAQGLTLVQAFQQRAKKCWWLVQALVQKKFNGERWLGRLNQ